MSNYADVVLKLGNAVGDIVFVIEKSALSRALTDIDARLTEAKARDEGATRTLFDHDARLSALEDRLKAVEGKGFRSTVVTIPPGQAISVETVSGSGGEMEYKVRQDILAPTAPATREPGLYEVRLDNHSGPLYRIFDGLAWFIPGGKEVSPNGKEYTWIGPRIEVPNP